MVILSLLLLTAAPVAAPPQPHARAQVISTVAKRRTRRGAKRRLPVGIPARLRVNECADPTTPGCVVKKQSPYRLPTSIAATGPSGKDRAVGMDGSDCKVIGQKVCPARTRPVLRAEYAPVGAK